MESINSFTPEVIERLILQVGFFNDFTEQEKQQVLNYMDAFLLFKPQEKILCANTEDDAAMYVLLSGRAIITTPEKDVYLDEVLIGDVFGEISFLTELPRTANVVAEEVCILWRIDHALLENSPIELREKIKDKLIEKLARVIGNSNRQLSKVFV